MNIQHIIDGNKLSAEKTIKVVGSIETLLEHWRGNKVSGRVSGSFNVSFKKQLQKIFSERTDSGFSAHLFRNLSNDIYLKTRQSVFRLESNSWCHYPHDIYMCRLSNLGVVQGVDSSSISDSIDMLQDILGTSKDVVQEAIDKHDRLIKEVCEVKASLPVVYRYLLEIRG